MKLQNKSVSLDSAFWADNRMFWVYIFIEISLCHKNSTWHPNVWAKRVQNFEIVCHLFFDKKLWDFFSLASTQTWRECINFCFIIYICAAHAILPRNQPQKKLRNNKYKTETIMKLLMCAIIEAVLVNLILTGLFSPMLCPIALPYILKELNIMWPFFYLLFRK